MNKPLPTLQWRIQFRQQGTNTDQAKLTSDKFYMFHFINQLWPNCVDIWIEELKIWVAYSWQCSKETLKLHLGDTVQCSCMYFWWFLMQVYKIKTIHILCFGSQHQVHLPGIPRTARTDDFGQLIMNWEQSVNYVRGKQSLCDLQRGCHPRQAAT